MLTTTEHTNHLGTPTALTDSNGSVQWQAHYTPFGKTIVDVAFLLNLSLQQAPRFLGQYFDEESGLHDSY